MNKDEFIKALAEKTGLTKKETEKNLDTILQTIEEELIKGQRLQFIGFGSFETKQRQVREGRNPRNPEQIIKIPAPPQKTKPAFKVL